VIVIVLIVVLPIGWLLFVCSIVTVVSKTVSVKLLSFVSLVAVHLCMLSSSLLAKEIEHSVLCHWQSILGECARIAILLLVFLHPC
jgi:hypothetical protein